MIFQHQNFVRGDRQRCLRMRSIVKKQGANQAQHAQHPYYAAAGAGGGPPTFGGPFPMMGFHNPYQQMMMMQSFNMPWGYDMMGANMNNRQMQLMGMTSNGAATTGAEQKGNYESSSIASVIPGMSENNVTGMSEVELASEIMKRGDPGMEPWKALEIAKHFKKK